MKIKTNFANYHETTWMVNTYGASLISWESLEMVVHKKMKVHNMGFQPVYVYYTLYCLDFQRIEELQWPLMFNYKKLFDIGSIRYFLEI
jgi:hypothetical protein